jgi:hypothetical protein
VAYRLTVLSFAVFGLIAVGCGSGNTADAGDSPSVSDRPPASSDDAPSNADAPPASADDAPPASADAPPGGSVSRPGGDSGAEAACEELCSSVAELGCYSQQTAASGWVRQVCDRGCDLNEEESLCESQALAFVNCLTGISELCSEEEGDASGCDDERRAVTECLDPDEKPPAGMGCTMAGLCDCANDCDTCHCELGAAGEQACALICDAP